MSANQPKGQHYVQQAYLEGFSNPNTALLHVYSPNVARWEAPAKSCAKQKYFYCFEHEGIKSFEAEKLLGRLEDHAWPEIERARDLKLPANQRSRMALAGYMALSHVRTPLARKWTDQAAINASVEQIRHIVQTPGLLTQVLTEIEQETGEKQDEEEFRRALKAGRVIGRQENRAWSLKIMMEEMFRLQIIFASMNWGLAAATGESSFLTSDSPVALQKFGEESIRLAFPISRDVCLLGGFEENGEIGEFDDEQVKQMNSCIIQLAHRYVFSPFEADYIQELFDHAATVHAASEPPPAIAF